MFQLFLSTQKKGSGVRSYKQPKRNAYKISDSSFGNLSVDVPKLLNEMKLNVRRGGKIIYQADADKSLVDLLTKRFNLKKSYSMNAVKIFNDLNLLQIFPNTHNLENHDSLDLELYFTTTQMNWRKE